MKFTNRQFGELEFDEQQIVRLREGLIGFEQYERFVIVDDVESEPFRWLVSVENTDLSFPLIDPSILLPEYHAEHAGGTEKTVYVVACLSDRIEMSSVNLRSPIVIDNATGEGRQMVLDDESLPFQFPLAPPNPIISR